MSFDIDEKSNMVIKIFGIGGGGNNALNKMLQKKMKGVKYIAVNTDSQALKNSAADKKIQIGKSLTHGLGAGARPEIGKKAIIEDQKNIRNEIDGSDIIFIIAGMGGGTGTGGAPEIAKIAKEEGVLSVGIITTPFQAEGEKRLGYASEGIEKLKSNCDTAIIIPNEDVLDVSDYSTTMMEAFDEANKIISNTAHAIIDLFSKPGVINLNFADIKRALTGGNIGITSSATASGEDRAEAAARKAINSQVINRAGIRGAQNILVNITSGFNLGMREATTATSIIQQESNKNTEIILGTVLEETLDEEIRITIILLGYDYSFEYNSINFLSKNLQKENLSSSTVENYNEAEEVSEKADEDKLELDVLINLGNANSEDLLELYESLSNLHRAFGGLGLVIDEDSEILDFELHGVNQ